MKKITIKTGLTEGKERPDCKTVEWLFEGQFGGKYGASSIQHILKDAVAVSKIRKKVTVHTLRHSFATHLLREGRISGTSRNFLGTRVQRRRRSIPTLPSEGLGK